ncbi:MAG TPA: caspase family protein, partial [Kofleriaceae bacterium]|nr:caspase family protein [Kofleriaceae bacterium]
MNPAGGTGRRVIAVIGIDRYRHWRALNNAVGDAQGARSLFLRLGFEEVTRPLFDDDATASAMQALVTDDLMALAADDSLVLFYAGHGGTRTQHVGGKEIKTGYLIPVDGANTPSRVATWIDLDGWLRRVSLLPPRHILVILDACYSGIALAPIVKWGRDGGAPLPYSALEARRSRIVITSALDDEIALDAGPVHGHSLFTGCLIQGLTGGLDASLVEQGRRLTTGSELGRYLRRRVLAFPDHLRLGGRQTPDFGSFDFDDRGEMLIPIAVNEPIAVGPGAVEPPRQVTPDATQPAPVSSPRVPETSGDRPPAAGGLAPQRTILGFPRERLREPRVQRAILYLAGTMLLAAGISGRPDNLPGGTFFEMFWLLSGAAYALLGIAPPGLRAKSGIPFLLAY